MGISPRLPWEIEVPRNWGNDHHCCKTSECSLFYFKICGIISIYSFVGVIIFLIHTRTGMIQRLGKKESDFLVDRNKELLLPGLSLKILKFWYLMKQPVRSIQNQNIWCNKLLKVSWKTEQHWLLLTGWALSKKQTRSLYWTVVRLSSRALTVNWWITLVFMLISFQDKWWITNKKCKLEFLTPTLSAQRWNHNCEIMKGI